jgi:hypothetical protein
MIIMDGMNRLLLLLGCSGALLCAADPVQVRTVYVMPMSRGLDQYLANRISGQHVFRVVTDPKLADAVLTDAIGESFQVQLESFSPTPKPAEPAAPAAPAKPAETPAKPAEASKPPAIEKPVKPARTRIDDSGTVISMFGDAENRVAPPVSTFGRGKGTIFLVDAKSRQIVWSTFDPSKSARNQDLDRTASDIVSRLKKDLKPKKEHKEQQ